MGTQHEFTVTKLVIGLPRQVVVQQCRRVDVDLCSGATARSDRRWPRRDSGPAGHPRADRPRHATPSSGEYQRLDTA
jgi:hypothetical protein